jgi:hypothetical protein
VHEGNRATRSAALVAGFGLIAWTQVLAALAVVLLVLALLPAAVAVRIGAPLCIATAGLLWFATSRALKVRPATPAGVAVTRTDAAALWALIDAAAATAQAAPPDGVTVIADAQVFVGERSRLIGLLGGPRQLYLGLPLLQAWDAARLGAVITHELAHSSTVLGRFAPVAYRGRVALARIVRRIPRRSPAGPLLRAYASFYLRLDAPFAWAQELAADRAAAAFAGPEAAMAVLRDAPALEGMQQLYHAAYLSAGWQAGFVPDDVFGGLLRVLAARPDEVDRLRALPAERPAEGDPHPPLSDRMTALAALTPAPDAAPAPAIAAVVAPDESAADLIPDLPGLGRALQAVAFPAAGRTIVDWDDFFSITRNAEMEREADAALRAIGHAVGTPVPGLAEVLDLVADGRLPKAAEVVFAGLPPAETTERITDLIALLLALAALRSGAARWRHSWSGTAELVAIDGGYLDLAQPAMLGADPATVDQARARLSDLGIDLTAAARPDPARPPARVPVHGGVVNVLADGARTDVLVLETGLLLIPSLPRSRNGDARRRLARLAAAGINPDGSLAANARASDYHPGHPSASSDRLTAADSSPRGTPAEFRATPEPAGPSTAAGDSAAVRAFAGASTLGSPAAAAVTAGGSAMSSTSFGFPAGSGAGVPSGSGAGVPSGSGAGVPSGSGADVLSGSQASPASGSEAADAATVALLAGASGGRMVSYADVTRAAVMQGRRRQWELTLAGGTVLTIRTTLDSDELQGGWAALDEAVAFLTRTRTPPTTRDQAPDAPQRDGQPAAERDSHASTSRTDDTALDPAEYLRDPATTPTSGGPSPAPAPTSGAS